MGAVVARLADLAVVTSDNPRTEDPEAIIDDVVAGMEDAPLLREADRREAIAAALDEASPGDLVLLAGKGHETYQVLGTEKHPFDEAAIVRELMGRGEGKGGS
jgi:UDP-N-acetylmuramoyl-L-alanyl-D-glutamate--2,6-diaminopimelate ligase